jgi:hypothetical protein
MPLDPGLVPRLLESRGARSKASQRLVAGGDPTI